MFEGRHDGGPTTRSRASIEPDQANYAASVKATESSNSANILDTRLAEILTLAGPTRENQGPLALQHLDNQLCMLIYKYQTMILSLRLNPQSKQFCMMLRP